MGFFVINMIGNLSVMNDRIISIDVLRGFALLGILIMNITSFAMPSMSYFSPLVYDVSFTNHIIYCISHVIADQKFMAIFSMLFGASTLLFINSSIKKGKRPFLLFYFRNFWLLIIGYIHSTYFWYGDILFIYAFCSFFLYFFKTISPWKQFILGSIIYLFPSITNYLAYEYVIDHLDRSEHMVIIEHWNPKNEVIQKELDVYRGSYLEQIEYRDKMWRSDQNNNGPGSIGKGILGLSLLNDLFSRSFGMMLIGMACFSWGVFSNTRSEGFYKKLILYGFGIGLPLSILGTFLTYYFDWNWKYVQFLSRSPNHIATPLIAFGYVGLIMIWVRKSIMQNLQERLRAIGKTALTSYLLQTILATFVFYGFGFGLFGYLDRLAQILVILLIWVFLLAVCNKWLNKFQYGPIEWIWRILTHMSFMPILKKGKK